MTGPPCQVRVALDKPPCMSFAEDVVAREVVTAQPTEGT